MSFLLLLALPSQKLDAALLLAVLGDSALLRIKRVVVAVARSELLVGVLLSILFRLSCRGPCLLLFLANLEILRGRRPLRFHFFLLCQE